MQDFLTILSPPYIDEFLQGLWLTLLLTGAFLVLGGLWAVVLTMLRTIPILNPLIGFYISLHRNIPMMVQMLFWYFAAPSLLPDFVNDWINSRASEVYFAIISISLGFGAYVSEDLRRRDQVLADCAI